MESRHVTTASCACSTRRRKPILSMTGALPRRTSPWRSCSISALRHSAMARWITQASWCQTPAVRRGCCAGTLQTDRGEIAPTSAATLTPTGSDDSALCVCATCVVCVGVIGRSCVCVSLSLLSFVFSSSAPCGRRLPSQEPSSLRPLIPLTAPRSRLPPRPPCKPDGDSILKPYSTF